MKFSFIIPHNKLRAAALLASTDETRYHLCGVNVEAHPGGVLLITTDGRRMGIFRHLTTEVTSSDGDNGSAPASAMPKFTIDKELIKKADQWGDQRAFNRLCDVLGDVGGNYPDSDDVRVSYETLTGEVSILSHGVTFVKDAIKVDGHCFFPDWRKSIPSLDVAYEGRVIPVAEHLLRSFCEVCEIFGDQMVLTPVGKHPTINTKPGEEGSLYTIVVQLRENRDFFGLLMPVRIPTEEPFVFGKPDWIK